MVSVLFAGAVLAPVKEHFEKRRDDSFPLSSYPMFANPRPPMESIVHVYKVDADGRREVVPYKYWSTGGMHDGRAQILAQVRDRQRREAVCERIAAAVGKRRPREGEPTYVAIEVVRSVWNRDSFFLERSWTPHREQVLVRCAVPERKSEPEPDPAAAPPVAP